MTGPLPPLPLYSVGKYVIWTWPEGSGGTLAMPTVITHVAVEDVYVFVSRPIMSP